MANFFTLVSIENMKLWKRISTKVMLLIMVVIVILATGIYKYHSVTNNISNNVTVSANWKQQLQKTVVVEKSQLAQQENSTSMTTALSIGTIKKTIAENEYSINNNIKPESKPGIFASVISFYSAGFNGLIILFTVIACTALVAGEFSEGTMKMMITRPYGRSQILSAKLLATIIYGIVLVLSTFILMFLFWGIFFGFNGVNGKEMLWLNSKIYYVPAVLKSLVILGLDFLQAIVFIIIAFALSAISRSRSIATGFSIFLLVIGGGIMVLLAELFPWGKYLPLADTGFSGYVSSGTAVAGTTLSFALIISFAYCVLFCFLGYFIFQNRDI